MICGHFCAINLQLLPGQPSVSRSPGAENRLRQAVC